MTVRKRSGTRPTAIRILLAHDLSPAAERAVALLTNSTWPDATVVRVVTSAVGIGSTLSSFGTVSEARARLQEARGAIAARHQRVATRLAAAGLLVETAIVHGRPERAILAESERFAADVVVLGARNGGPLSSVLLGSVSRAVVETAACSVLVARGSAVTRAVLAVDGSAAARLATAIVASWPMFSRVSTLVVAVGPALPGYAGLVSGSEALLGHAGTLRDATAGGDRTIAEAVDELVASGRTVESEIRLGNPGAEIVAAARTQAADLVAMGANDEPRLRRMVLGSVARTVLDAVDASVLVARPKPTIETG